MFALCIECSHARGMGHFYRALNLAEYLFQLKFAFVFYLNNDKPSLAILAERDLPHRIVDLNDISSNWESELIRVDGIVLWINDRLNTDHRHAHKVKAEGVPLVTFDDRGTGAALADLNIAALSFNENEIFGGARVLRGTEYLILNSQIKECVRVRTRVDSILVTMGGSDTYGVTVVVVKMLKELGFAATVVIGPSFAHQAMLKSTISEDFVIKQGLNSLIHEYLLHDLAITGGGITPFEANASGLPCVIIANEIFEIPAGRELERLGCSSFVGYHKTLESPLFNLNLPIEQMSINGINNIWLDGSQRVVSALMELLP